MARQSLIAFRRDTAANWTSTNPTLAEGELGFETNTGKVKIGTGSTAWNSLDYVLGKYTLSQLSGITLSSLSNNDILSYNSTGGYWQDKTASDLGLVSSNGYRLIETVAYTSSTTMPSSANYRAIRIKCIGGGGGSGGCAIGAASAGGSGGNYSESFVLTNTIYNTPTITVGAGGTAGTNSPTSGGDGGRSSVSFTIPNIIQSGSMSGGNTGTYVLIPEAPIEYLPQIGDVVGISGFTNTSINESFGVVISRNIAERRFETDDLIGTGNQASTETPTPPASLTYYLCIASGGNGSLSESTALVAPDFESGTLPNTGTGAVEYGDFSILGGASGIVSFETSTDLYASKPGAAPGYPIGDAQATIATSSRSGSSANSGAYGAGAFGAMSISSNKASGGAGNPGIVIIEYYA
jgi:hypothetical protein